MGTRPHPNSLIHRNGEDPDDVLSIRLTFFFPERLFVHKFRRPFFPPLVFGTSFLFWDASPPSYLISPHITAPPKAGDVQRFYAL